VRETVLAHTERIFDLTFSPDSSLVATASRDRTIGVHRAEDGTGIRALPDDGRGLAWVSMDELLAVGGTRGIRVWDPQREIAVGRSLPSADSIVGAVHLGDRILAAGEDGRVTVWGDDGSSQAASLPGDVGAATVIANVGEGRAVVGHATGYLSVWDATTATGAAWPAHEMAVTAIDHDLATGVLVVGDVSGRISFWDPRNRRRNGPDVRVPACTIRALLAVPRPRDGLAIGCNESQALRWWSAADGGPTAELVIRQGGRINDLALDLQGDRLIGGTTNGNTAVWSLAGAPAWSEPTILRARSDEIRAVALAAGDRIVTGSWDGLVQLWDLATSSQIGPPWRLAPPIRDLSVSPDGLRVAVTSGAGVLELDLDEAAWRAAACEIAGREFTPTEWRQYVDPSGRVVPSCS
jgi:WD40 repeat protein